MATVLHNKSKIFIFQAYAYPDEFRGISHVAHACGGSAGLLIGIFILTNRKVEDWEGIVQYIALAVYGVIVLIFIVLNIPGVVDLGIDSPPASVQNLYKICKTEAQN